MSTLGVWKKKMGKRPFDENRWLRWTFFTNGLLTLFLLTTRINVWKIIMPLLNIDHVEEKKVSHTTNESHLTLFFLLCTCLMSYCEAHTMKGCAIQKLLIHNWFHCHQTEYAFEICYYFWSINTINNVKYMVWTIWIRWEKINIKLLFTKRLMVCSIDFEWITINFPSFFLVGDGLDIFFLSLNFQLICYCCCCFFVWKQKPKMNEIFFSLIWWEFFKFSKWLKIFFFFQLTVRDLHIAFRSLDTEIQYVLRLHYHVPRLRLLRYSDHFCYYVNRLLLPLLRHCVESLQ